MDTERVIKGLECCVGKFPGEEYCKTCIYQPYRFGMCKADSIKDAIDLINEQNRLLHKKENDIDKLCIEISQLKHKIHDEKPTLVWPVAPKR